jgi:hypothetical protein
MAEEKTKKGAGKLYGKSPRIKEKAVAGEGDTNKSGHEAEAAAAAAKPPRAEGTMKEGGNAKGDVMAGTAGVETHHHAHERNQMHARHAHERHEMHVRHQHEHSMREAGHHHETHQAMAERHHKELQRMHTRHEGEHREMHERHFGGEGGEGPTGGITEKPEGKGGTEPPREKNG